MLLDSRLFSTKTLWSLASTPAVRTLVFCGLTWLVIFTILKSLLWRDPHSGFFADATVYDLKYSAHRLDQARQFIDHAEAAVDIPKPHRGPDPVICAGLVTVSRNKRQYLNETMGSLLVGLTPEERSAINVRLLFGNSDPSVHPDWEKKWLRTLDHWAGYENLTAETRAHLQKLEQEEDVQRKAVFDYVYILQECMRQTTAPYIAIFEDDIVFADGWLSKTIAGLGDLRARTNAWLYLRLFYTETFLGWDPEDDYWYANKEMTAGLVMACTFFVTMCLRVVHRPLRRFLDIPTIAVLVLAAAPAFTALTFMVGKYNLMPMRGVVLMNKPGCCTQALIFPRNQIDSLIEMLEARGTGQTDLMVEDYARIENLQRYALAPQVVQHVGLISSRGMAEIHTKSVWAFWFEAQDKEKLKAEHERLSRGGIWRASGDGSA